MRPAKNEPLCVDVFFNGRRMKSLALVKKEIQPSREKKEHQYKNARQGPYRFFFFWHPGLIHAASI